MLISFSMQIPDCIVWVMEDGSCTAVKIYCKEDLRKEISVRFEKYFNEEYEKVMDLIEEEAGDCYEKDMDINPFKKALISEYGIFLSFDNLAMYCGLGDIIARHNAGEALENALNRLKREYPSINYEGYVAYVWSDIHSGDVCQYKISSKKEEDTSEVVYDFIGKELGVVLQKDETWDRLSENLVDADENEFKRILKFLYVYSKWIPSDMMNRVIDIAKEQDEVFTKSLERFVQALKKDENIEIEGDTIDTNCLPDKYKDYFEALAAAAMAEEDNEEEPIDIEFTGKIFVLTGLDTKTEYQITNIITSRGGIIKSSTVLNTDYLIYDERHGTDTKKHERAMELIGRGKSIKMITSKQFMNQVK